VWDKNEIIGWAFIILAVILAGIGIISYLLTLNLVHMAWIVAGGIFTFMGLYFINLTKY